MFETLLTLRARHNEVVIFALLLLLLAFAHVYPVETSSWNDFTTITLEIWIYDINPVNRTAGIEIRAHVRTIREYNTTWITVGMGGSVRIQCNKTTFGNNTFPSQFDGTCKTRWNLWGIGDNYPFDTYILPFEISTENGPLFEISSNSSVHLATTQTIRDWTSNLAIKGSRLEVQLTRNPLIPFLQFLLPIIACYYLLGATLILETRRLSERLRVYLSLFIFAPTFMFTIQKFLPFRLSLALPEFLLTNLLVSTAIFGIFSMIGNRTTTNRNIGNHRNTIRIDIAAAVLSLFIFPVLYVVTMFKRIDIRGAFVTYLIIQSYIYWLFLRIPRKRTKHTLLTYVVLLLIPIIVALFIH